MHPIATADWPERSHELAQLLARSGLGDRSAFARLYERTSAQLYAVVLRIQRDRGAAEDLLQEVYVSVWKAASGFDTARAQPMTWLTSIARNRAIDSLRRQATQPQIECAPPDDGDDDRPGLIEQQADDTPGPLELLGRAAEARELDQCMQHLSAAQRQSVALAFFDGLSHAEVAEHLCEPLGTVKSWVRRALLLLRSCLDRSAAQDLAAGPAARS